MAKYVRKTSKNMILPKKMGNIVFLTAFFGKKAIKKALTVVFFGLSLLNLSGQQNTEEIEVQSTIQTIIEDFTEFNDGNADFDFNTLYEDLRLLYFNKLNLNRASSEEMSKLIFLSDIDIQNIISYRTSYGPFISIYELQSVPGLTAHKLASLKLFAQISNQTTKSTKDYQISELNRSKDQLFVKWRYNIETARNFQSINGAAPRYIGDKNHFYLRYNHTDAKSKYGLIYEKDAGEQWGNQFSETRLEYLSAHYQITEPNSWIQQLNLGDYSISLGQGLVVHSAFGIGKSSLTTRVKKGRGGIKAFTSVAENVAFRGVAMKVAPQKSRLSALIFGSYTPRDANLRDNDSLGVVFSSLPQGGLHRTIGEREDQDATYEFSSGANLSYKISEGTQIGINAVHHRYDKEFQTTLQPYQLYRWQGRELTNLSLDYNALLGGWNIFGEIARSSNNGWAQMHGLIKTLDPTFDISVIYRNYTPEYQSLFANGFGESTTVNNERGLFVGLEYRPAKKWSIKAFADQWRNDWLRFRVDGLGTGQEYLLRVDFKEKRRRHYYMQYRYEIKDENSSADLIVDLPVAKTTQRLRLHASHNLSDDIELRSRVEFSLFKKESETEQGILVYQDFISRKKDSPLTLSARIAYFNISDFDARIYTYENDLMFEYYIPSFSGKGLRYYVHARYNFSRKLMGEIRWEQTKSLQTGLVVINDDIFESSVASRIKAQIRFSF